MRAANTCGECDPCERDGCCEDLKVEAKPVLSPSCVNGCKQLRFLDVSWGTIPQCLTLRAAGHEGIKQFEVHLDCPENDETGVPDGLASGGNVIHIGRADFDGGPDCEFDFEESYPRICFIVRANDGSELLRCVLCPKGKDLPCSSSSSASGETPVPPVSSGSSGSSGSSKSSGSSAGGTSASSASSDSSSSGGGGGGTFHCGLFNFNLSVLTECVDGVLTYRFTGSIPLESECGNPTIYIADQHGEIELIGGLDFLANDDRLEFDKTRTAPCTPGEMIHMVVQLRCDDQGMVCEQTFDFPLP